MPSPLDAAALDRALQGTMFAGNVHVFATIDSTNTYAMREGAAGAPGGSVYIASEQTAGRGRGAHRWHSEPDSGVYMSLLLRPRIAPADALWLSLAAGLAVQQGIADVTGLKADIRWPNDLLLGGRKFCGILTEMNAEATQVRYAVTGIGINVNHAMFPEELQWVATSLRVEAGREQDRTAVAAAILRALDAELRDLIQADTIALATASLLTRFEECSTWARGKRVSVDEAGGYTGVTAGLDARGFLRVDTGTEMRTVLSGGVRELTSGV
jgi:BirA family biotin operon repressor/biotin-[acetyl-CoA-carboxylase] ligase